MTPDREPRDGESRDREGGTRPVPPHVDPTPDGPPSKAISTGDRVRIDQTDRDEPIIGTVAEIKTEWGRHSFVLDVPDRDRQVTVWERADREITKLPDKTDGGRVMTDGGTVEEPPGHIGHPDYTPHNVMREWNPDEWDPEPDPDHYKAGEVNVWDPIEGEGFNEPGHWAHRDPDMSETHARRLALRGEFDGLEEEQPMPLLSSNMSGVPTEGVQGSYSHVIELDDDCPECGQSWGVHVCHSTMGGVHTERCLLCGYELMRV